MTDDDVLPYYRALQKLKHHYKELYGNPDEDDFSLIWETKKSTITLWNYKSVISVEYEYEDVNYIK